ncbi:hypothetical protein NQ318_015106 [Aromia moschata]|uniref:non-specific serine/threonine protein kinase n=1 Tax=Aromia moschata TaxID=1265417 RepID=A0AAV8YX23_9CUCU|nr:hypothetical protein NQ318_015106 [Aromia moschata]
MESSEEPISVRIARINSEIIGKNAKLDKTTLLARETLLDVLLALYEECCLENLQKYDLTIGSTPFVGQNSTSVYSKIMNHRNTLKFPPDVVLSQAYVGFVKSLLTDANNRLDSQQVRNHDLFRNLHFDTLRDQVPPYVPKITAVDDTSNFSDVQAKRKNPNIESFKKRSQFSGRNLPFVGFTFTHDPDRFGGEFDRKVSAKDELVEGLKSEVQALRRRLAENDGFQREREGLERKLEEKQRKLESVDGLRDRLERDLANSIGECTALKRTLELERKERAELERKALDLIKAAKLKWETAEKNKVEALQLELEQQKEKVSQLTATNNMLNEQLQHALKMEGRHKESLEKVQHLSRRSVLGLESRLERITSDTQGTISELQRKLTRRDAEATLARQLEQSEKEYDGFRAKFDEAERVIRQLSDQVSALEEDVEQIQQYKEEIAGLREQVDDGRKKVKELENRNTYLHMETRTLEEYKREVEEMKRTVSAMQNDKRAAQLESQLLEEREKCQALKKQLQESENILTENQELKELRTKYWRMEKEFGNCKIDKRILERELKDAQAEIKSLNGKIEAFDETLAQRRKAHEAAILELSNINETISMELIKAKDTCDRLQDKLNNERDKSEEGKRGDQRAEGNNKRQGDSNLDNEIHKRDEEKSKLLESVERLQKEKGELYDELEKARREIENTNLNLAALREACTLLEGQVIEYEKINASSHAKQSELNANTEKLIQDVCKAKQEVQEARKQTNEEKSLRLLAETKIKRMREDIECLQGECSSYKQQCVEYKTYSTTLSDELTVAEEKISDLEVTLKAYERQVDDLRSENKVLKQEVSEYLTQLGKMKEANYKLNHQVGQLKEGKAEAVQRASELERVLNEKSNFYKEREMKSEQTIRQQIKLIDYLQTKNDELNSKKRTITEVIFGSSKKENQPPVSLPLNYKDLEAQLLKERQANRQLNEEIYKLKAATCINDNGNLMEKMNAKVERHRSEILSPKSKVAMQQIVNSPSKQKSDLYRQNSVQRMHHNIPHRYDSKLCTKSTKCAGCLEPVSLGRSMNVCRECGAATHPHCSSKLPNTCGLPQVYVNHYKDSLKPKNDEDVQPEPSKSEAVNVEGWIKIPGKAGGWEKRYACLTETSINVYSSPPNEKNSSLVQAFALKPEETHGKVISEPIPSEIGVAPNTTCWPQNCLIFMTLTAQEKDKWFLALQKFFYEDLEKPKLDHVLSVPEGLNVNCVLELTENVKVIGSERGLYSYHEKKLLAIEGLTAVHHISIMPTAGVVLMIVNLKSVLISCDLNHLVNLTQGAQCTKPKLKYNEVNVNNMTGFHFLQVSRAGNRQKVCVATSKQLVILQYYLETTELVPLRVLDTAEPVSCVLFTDNSLIVGADKFFEIDLATFRAEEFLDVSDAKLRPAVKCYRMGSFPLSIIQVSKSPKEYLLCFNEFSVFVDEYGRSTRKREIKSSHLPLAFHFSEPYLYVVQFSAVEFVRLSEETCNEASEKELDSTRLELERFRYVGCNKKGVYVLQGGDVKFVDARKFVEGDLSSVASESTENESDRFSFTSSLVQSLDGNMSDSESLENDRQRKVKFSQTNL